MSLTSKKKTLEFALAMFMNEKSSLESRMHKSAVGMRHAKNMFWISLPVTIITLIGAGLVDDPLGWLVGIVMGSLTGFSGVVWVVNNNTFNRDERWLGQTEESIQELRAQIADLTAREKETT